MVATARFCDHGGMNLHTEVFRPRGSIFLAGLMWLVGAIFVAVGIASTREFSSLPVGLTVAFFGYWLFWYPVVQVGLDGVTVRNPMRTIAVAWPALVTVDTKYALTLVTENGKYTAWAAPAPSALESHLSKSADAKDLPANSYGLGGMLRPGDLKNTNSGAAAFLVRSYWEQLAEAGKLELPPQGAPAVSVRFNTALVIAAVVLVLVSAWALS